MIVEAQVTTLLQRFQIIYLT